jgi:hypothetical protein
MCEVGHDGMCEVGHDLMCEVGHDRMCEVGHDRMCEVWPTTISKGLNEKKVCVEIPRGKLKYGSACLSSWHSKESGNISALSFSHKDILFPQVEKL